MFGVYTALDARTQLIDSYKQQVNASEQAAIDWFDRLDVTENGRQKVVCALWFACVDGNARLITHIISKDDTLVDECYNDKPMLEWAMARASCVAKSTKSWEQAKQCTQILIDAGADVNVRCGTWPNLLAAKVAMLTAYMINRQIVRMEYLEQVERCEAAFWAGNGAKCCLFSDMLDIEEKAELVALGEPDYVHIPVAIFIKSLNEAREQALRDDIAGIWSKLRLICLASKSADSPFSIIPTDLIALIRHSTTNQYFKKGI